MRMRETAGRKKYDRGRKDGAANSNRFPHLRLSVCFVDFAKGKCVFCEKNVKGATRYPFVHLHQDILGLFWDN